MTRSGSGTVPFGGGSCSAAHRVCDYAAPSGKQAAATVYEVMEAAAR